ncbi:ferritin-like domain-containing protein [Bacillus nitratireducens]|uniref:ferritin-like domain-containing protein n=1 Tax=Bacillus nitratireducens TaxID=2026193 RepID=UPI0030846270
MLQPNFEVGVLLSANSGIKHFHQFVQIYTLLTSKNPQPQITEVCPTLYLNGLEFAIQDAQRSVDFHLEIADEATDQQIKEVFRRVAADEQNHTVWFLYYFSKQNKK